MAFRTFTTGEVLTAALVNTYLMQQVNIVCTSGARPSSPVDGMEIYETDTKLKRRWFAAQGAWVIWPPQVAETTDTSTVSTSSESWTVGSPTCDATFVAPPAGRALVIVAGNIEGYGTEGGVYLGWEIRNNNAAGSVVVSTADDNAVMNQGVGNIQASTQKHISGLTGGNTYYIRTMHRSGGAGNSISVFMRRITVMPLAN